MDSEDGRIANCRYCIEGSNTRGIEEKRYQKPERQKHRTSSRLSALSDRKRHSKTRSEEEQDGTRKSSCLIQRMAQPAGRRYRNDDEDNEVEDSVDEKYRSAHETDGVRVRTAKRN